MLEEPPVDQDGAVDTAPSGWGFDDDDVPEAPSVVDVDASTLVPGAETAWPSFDDTADAGTGIESELEFVDDADGDIAAKVFDLDQPDHDAPAWDVPDGDVRSVVTSAFADLDLLDDDRTDADQADVESWDAESSDSLSETWDAGMSGSTSVGWDAESSGSASADLDGAKGGTFDLGDDDHADADADGATADEGPWLRSDDDIVPTSGRRRFSLRRG